MALRLGNLEAFAAREASTWEATGTTRHLETSGTGNHSGNTLHLEVHVQVRIERGLQTGITHRDAQGVRIVVDIEQLRDIRL